MSTARPIGTIIKETLRGKSLARILMNIELTKYTLKGSVLDIGGGDMPSYLRFITKDAHTQLIAIDLMAYRGGVKLDLEKDPLPYEDQSMNYALLFNILEHIYHHQFLLKEVKRVLKHDGVVLGFVPFLVNVHPDPHDFFRYTKECLEILFTDAGFKKIGIKEIGSGPFAVCYDHTVDFFPRIVRLPILFFCYILDRCLLVFKPALSKKFPIGYFFSLTA